MNTDPSLLNRETSKRKAESIMRHQLRGKRSCLRAALSVSYRWHTTRQSTIHQGDTAVEEKTRTSCKQQELTVQSASLHRQTSALLFEKTSPQKLLGLLKHCGQDHRANISFVLLLTKKDNPHCKQKNRLTNSGEWSVEQNHMPTPWKSTHPCMARLPWEPHAWLAWHGSLMHGSLGTGASTRLLAHSYELTILAPNKASRQPL
jgi:hypothetical protein